VRIGARREGGDKFSERLWLGARNPSPEWERGRGEGLPLIARAHAFNIRAR